MRFRSCVPVVVILFCVVAGSMPALADPIPSVPPTQGDLAYWFGMLVAMNFVYNLFWFPLIFAAVLGWKGTKAGRFGSGRFGFHARTIAAVILITLTGAAIDFALLVQYENGWPEFAWDTGRSAAAALLVGLTVFVSSWFVTRMKPIYSLLPAAGMMAMNIVSWFQLYMLAFGSFLCIPVVMVLIIVIFFELDKWHRRVFSEKMQGTSDVAGHP